MFDCGAFNGDTICDFIKFTEKKYSKIISFEPGKENFKKLAEYVNVNHLENIKIINAGVGLESKKISFIEEDNSSRITLDPSDANSTIDIVKLDDFISEKPTLIKMDIEGCELDALKGAINIIKEYKPKLAICIYHKPFDFYEIITFLNKLVPEYKFKIRQHSLCIWETVLYAYI